MTVLWPKMNILCPSVGRGWNMTKYRIKRPNFLDTERLPASPEKCGTKHSRWKERNWWAELCHWVTMFVHGLAIGLAKVSWAEKTARFRVTLRKHWNVMKTLKVQLKRMSKSACLQDWPMSSVFHALLVNNFALISKYWILAVWHG